jgi:hypothetical protein
VGPRAVLDAVVVRKIPSSRRESNHRTPFIQPVPSAVPTEPKSTGLRREDDGTHNHNGFGYALLTVTMMTVLLFHTLHHVHFST